MICSCRPQLSSTIIICLCFGVLVARAYAQHGLQCVWHLQFRHTSYVISIRISADDGLLVSSSLDHTIRVWRVADGAELAKRHVASPCGTVLFHPSSSSVVFSDGNRIWEWDWKKN